ncbi:DALR anticodon-binding domain-containing protein [Chloroflexota bacterium]
MPLKLLIIFTSRLTYITSSAHGQSNLPYHSFYKQCRVISRNEALTKARLKLVEAATHKIVPAKTLHLMGVTAPERM